AGREKRKADHEATQQGTARRQQQSQQRRPRSPLRIDEVHQAPIAIHEVKVDDGRVHCAQLKQRRHAQRRTAEHGPGMRADQRARAGRQQQARPSAHEDGWHHRFVSAVVRRPSVDAATVQSARAAVDRKRLRVFPCLRCPSGCYNSMAQLLWRPTVKQLIAYLLDHLMLDFDGDLTLETVRDFLRDDDSREGRALVAKLVEDRGVEDMMVTLADCLKDYLRTGVNEEVMREQIRTYAES